MVDQSAAVVVGEVTEQHSTETAHGLYTMTTFSVSDEVIGDTGSTVTVATPGGIRVNGKFKLAETWPGAPVFIRGQEVLMFLTADDGPVGAQIVGFSQGAAGQGRAHAGWKRGGCSSGGREIADSPDEGRQCRNPHGSRRHRSVTVLSISTGLLFSQEEFE